MLLGALILHYGASEAGTIFSVDDDAANESLDSTNAKVEGSFVASSTNYIGLDLVRAPDASTSDSVQFYDASSADETSETIPLSRTLQYKIVISTQNFTISTNIIPIAKVITNSTNAVVSITDTRKMMFRLGSGGDAANSSYKYPWGSRTENAILYTGGNDPFVGEDKNINNLKSWMDTVMTSIWEIRGGEHWYSPVNFNNLKINFGPISTLADNVVFDTVSNPDLLKWESLAVTFENANNSGVYFNTIANNTAGVSFNTDGMCLYVDITRESNATNIPASVGNLQTLGSSSIPGRRVVIAWRRNGQVYVRDRPYEAGRTIPIASTSVNGIVQLSAASNTPATPKVITDGGGTINKTLGGAGLTVDVDDQSLPGSGVVINVDNNTGSGSVGLTINNTDSGLGGGAGGLVINSSGAGQQCATLTSAAGSCLILNNTSPVAATISIANLDPSGPGIDSGSSIAVGSSVNFKYSSAVTRRFMIAPEDFRIVSGDISAVATTTIPPRVQTSAGSWSVWGRIRIPGGSTITAIEARVGGAVGTINTWAATWTKGNTGAGYQATSDMTQDLMIPNSTALATALSPAWVNFAPFTSRVMPEDGWAYVQITTATASVSIYAIRVTYTQIDVKPAN
jgi:hypothetical protein